MDIKNEQSVILPKELEAAIEAGKNKVTMFEAESTRLGKLNMTVNKEIVAANATLDDVKKQTTTAMEELESVKGLIDKGNDLLTTTTNEQQEIEKQNKAKKAEWAERESALAKKEKVIAQEREALDLRENTLAEAEKSYTQKSNKLDTQVNILNEALDAIKAP